jgi:cell division transport system permease protein
VNPRVAGFIWRSLRSSLRGEPLTHLLTLTTVCACLGLVAAVHLSQRNLVQWAEQWAAEQAVLVYVQPQADAKARDGIERGAHRADLVDLSWRSPRDSAADLAAAVGLQNDATLDEYAPWILQARRSAATTATHVTAIAALPGVLHLDEGTLVAERIRNLARTLRSFGGTLALLLLVGCFLVVSNTVGLALNARRDEVEIMGLVGTPLGWIYAAYLAEGVLLGALGAVVAAAVVQAALHFGVTDLVAGFGLPALRGLTYMDAAGLAVIGAAIGAAGSAIAIQRFLRPPSAA